MDARVSLRYTTPARLPPPLSVHLSLTECIPIQQQGELFLLRVFYQTCLFTTILVLHERICYNVKSSVSVMMIAGLKKTDLFQQMQPVF